MTTFLRQQATVMRQHLSAQPDTVVEIAQTSTSTTGTSEMIIEYAEPVHDNALRGEDYPALVRVWDNDVDAAIYDKD